MSQQFKIILKKVRAIRLSFRLILILTALIVVAASSVVFGFYKNEGKEVTSENIETSDIIPTINTNSAVAPSSNDNSNTTVTTNQNNNPVSVATPQPATPPPTPQPEKEYYSVMHTWSNPPSETIIVSDIGIVAPLGISFNYNPTEPCNAAKYNIIRKRLTQFGLVEGSKIALETDADFPDKTMAAHNRYIYLTDGTLVNRTLVAEGYATTITTLPFKYQEEFLDIEANAKKNKLGIWDSSICPNI